MTPGDLYGPTHPGLPALPRSERAGASSASGGANPVDAALRACHRVARNGRELGVVFLGPRLVRVRVREQVGPRGGWRVVGYLHAHDSGRVDATGWGAERLARDLRGAP